MKFALIPVLLLELSWVSFFAPAAFALSTEHTEIIQWGVSGDVPLPGDYDGDGKADVAIFRPSDGTWHILGSTGTAWTNSWGISGDIPVPADYDGDGKTDVATWRPSDGTWRISRSTGASWISTGGEKGDVPVPADYYGNGKAIPAIFRPSNGKWYLSPWKGEFDFTAAWGTPGDIPLPGDYDGDGKADAAFFRSSDSTFRITYTGGGIMIYGWNVAGDIPVPGDYNGDGKNDAAVWRPSDATFHISFTGGGTEVIALGAPSDIPVPADYSGDGKTQVAVFRPSDGTWHISKAGEKSSVNESPQYHSRRWQTEEGLPHNSISAVIQTRDQYLWLGTPKGLARFDGAQFTVFNSQNTPELKELAIRSLCQTRDGTLWIAAEKGGLNFLRKGQFGVAAFMANQQVRVMFESRDGSLWIGTTNGLACYKNEHCTWFTKENGLPNNTVLAICEDRDGNLWFGTSGGLVSYKEKFATTYDEKNGLPANSVRALLCDSENNLWIGTGGGGLVRFRDGRFREFKKPQGLPDGFIYAIFEDSRKQLWVGTQSGLCRRVGEKFTAETNHERVSYETVFCLTEDSENNLWFGTKEGLHQLRAKPFRSYSAPQLSHNNVMSVCEDSQKNIWIPTWGGGLNRLKGTKTTTYNRANSSLYDLLLSVCETRDGSLWFGGDHDGGLFRFKSGTFTRYGQTNGIIDPAIRVIYEDRQTNLWIGTSGGLYLRQGDAFERCLAGETIRSLCENHDGNLWIGTQNGLQRRTGKTFSPVSGITNPVLSIFEDRERSLWIGTSDGGLGRMKNGKWKMENAESQGKERFTFYGSQQGLFSDSIFEILEDESGHLWMSCSSGIFRVSKKNLDDFDHGKIQTISCASFGKTDGMASVQCNGVSKPAGWKGKDGRLWFPTTRGVTVVDPNSIRENDSPPPIVVEDIIADKRKLPPSQGLTIPPGKGDLEFHYTALSFSTPEKNRFKYKLEGVDTDWVEAKTRRVAYYNNIKPGTYTFRANGCNNDGVWNSLGANVKFTLLPHFWQTKWFVGLIGLAAVGSVAAAARYMTWMKVQGQLQRLEQQHAIEKERTRIAQDMHDDLGVRLSEIVMLSDMTHRKDANLAEVQTCTGKISQAARELVDNLDAIVWAVNPKNDSLDKFADYLVVNAPLYLEMSGIRCGFDAPSSLPSYPLSSEIRHNIFLVVREALHNTVKHAQASEVRISLKLEHDALVLHIADNGKGFARNTDPDFGNGLANMEARMKNIGGSFRLASEPGKGTRIELQIPLKHF